LARLVSARGEPESAAAFTAGRVIECSGLFQAFAHL
jgi:hypothetical protein